MAQVKKQEVRTRILNAAEHLFALQGYGFTSMAQIAEAAQLNVSNIYVYFDSKVKILYAIYDPWLRARLAQLQDEIAKVARPDDRLRMILRTLWGDIAGEHNGFANNMMQAVSTVSSDDGYTRDLLLWTEHVLSLLIESCLTEARRAQLDCACLAHVLLMAFDGFVMHYRLNGRAARLDDIIETMVGLLLPGAPDGRAPVNLKKSVILY